MKLDLAPGRPAPARGSRPAVRGSGPCRRSGASPAQHAGGAALLEGEVEVGHHLGAAGQRRDQAGPQLGGLQVGKSDPVQTPSIALSSGSRVLEQPQVAEVLAVGRRVLADQHQLADALLGQPARLGHQVLRRPGQERAAERGDGAEAAPPVAAGSDLERGDRPAGQPAPQRPRPGRRARPPAAGPGSRRRAGRPGSGGVPVRRDPGPRRAGRRAARPAGRGDRQQPAPVPRLRARDAAGRPAPSSSRAPMSP